MRNSAQAGTRPTHVLMVDRYHLSSPAASLPLDGSRARGPTASSQLRLKSLFKSYYHFLFDSLLSLMRQLHEDKSVALFDLTRLTKHLACFFDAPGTLIKVIWLGGSGGASPLDHGVGGVAEGTDVPIQTLFRKWETLKNDSQDTDW